MRNLSVAVAILLCMLSCNSANENSTSSQVDTTSITVNDTSPAPDTAPTIQLALPFVWGIDISSYQGDEIAFLDAKKDTLTFVICKATEGVTVIDPEFSNNWNTIDQKGFVRGAYHFYHCNDDPVKQAAHFISTVKSFDKEDFPPIIDFEEASVGSNCGTVSKIRKDLLQFLQQVESKTGQKPIIYTDNNTGGRYLNDTSFLQYHLFIADYNKGSAPRLPAAWKDKGWILWQKSESYRIHSTTDDFDVFNGGIEEFNKFIGR